MNKVAFMYSVGEVVRLLFVNSSHKSTKPASQALQEWSPRNSEIPIARYSNLGERTRIAQNAQSCSKNADASESLRNYARKVRELKIHARNLYRHLWNRRLAENSSPNWTSLSSRRKSAPNHAIIRQIAKYLHKICTLRRTCTKHATSGTSTRLELLLRNSRRRHSRWHRFHDLETSIVLHVTK